jgi:soluble lytic murein transglycosylase-like protein
MKTIQQILQGEEAAISSQKGAPPVSLDTAQIAALPNITTFDTDLTSAASRYNIDRNWLKALMFIESSGDPTVVSSAGACGLLQLLPSTADQYDDGIKNNNSITCDQLKVPAKNIDIAAHYLHDLMADPCPVSTVENPICFYKTRNKDGSLKSAVCTPSLTRCNSSSVSYAIAAYNGGQCANCSSATCAISTWWECEANAGFAETRAYVQKAWAAYNRVRQF